MPDGDATADDDTTTDSETPEDSYTIREELPDPETFAALREVAGMPPRSLEGIERGLPNSLYGVIAIHDPTGAVVGMGRIVGDDGTVYRQSRPSASGLDPEGEDRKPR